MLAVAKTLVKAAPSVVATADKAVDTMTGGRSKSVVSYLTKSANDPVVNKSTAELLVRSGLDSNVLSDMLNQFGVPDRQAIMQHLVAMNLARAQAITAVAATLNRADGDENVSAEEQDFYNKIHRVAGKLGVTGVDAIMEIAIVMNTITETDARKYKIFGLKHPRLGYN